MTDENKVPEEIGGTNTVKKQNTRKKRQRMQSSWKKNILLDRILLKSKQKMKVEEGWL